jgi:putative CocE/NonD family hydrolase
MAFVAQDTRGRHDSEGEPTPFGCEAGDGWDTCDWIVAQPWSDGTIAVFGESYVGFTALALAAAGHPAVRAAALRNTASDIAGDWLRHQGVVRLEFLVRWALAAWSGRDNLAPELDWTIRPLRAHVPALVPDRIPGVLDAWARGAGPARLWPDDAGWPSLVDRVRVPVHLTTGWWDLFTRGALRDWERFAARGSRGDRLSVEPTDHAGHDWGDGPTPDPLADFDALAARMPVVLERELAFLRRHLLGDRTRAAADPVDWMLTHAGPRTAASWPPPGARPRRLHLVDAGNATRGPEGGGLSSRADVVPVRAPWRHDPGDLVPALEGEAVAGWFRRPDERRTQVRGDVLTFSSDPVRHPLDLAGPVTADLLVDTGAAGGHVVAKLCDVYPEGEARRIADGAYRLPPAAGTHRAPVDLGSTGYRVRPGHRLRLEVAASAFPRYIPHPGTSADPWDAARTRPLELALRTGPDASALVLTVLEDEAAG